MKRKKYLHTNFLKFLIESERQAQKEVQNEIEEDEVQELEDEIEEEDEVQELDADEIIERLVQSHKKLKKEYDDIVSGRKRK